MSLIDNMIATTLLIGVGDARHIIHLSAYNDLRPN